MFADDTTINKCKQSANPIIDIDLRHMSNWIVYSKLTVSAENFEASFFGSKQLHDFSDGQNITPSKVMQICWK